ncbi:transposase family protein [Bacillus xiapuensis]|uniref:transposase family protein n=1 Tax=Bacillus xiapuensis TaxID=2014075 RepID=UPI000C23F27D
MMGRTQLLFQFNSPIDMIHEHVSDNELFCIMNISSSSARCPSCDVFSSRAHSHYTRKIDDLPISGRHVTLQIRLRKWFCDEPSCSRKIFTERLSWAHSYRRKTTRLEKILTELTLSTNCLAAERSCKALHIRVSHDTLLRLVKSMDLPERKPSPFCRNR